MQIQKTNKFIYYLKGYLRTLFPVISKDKLIKKLENNLSDSEKLKVLERIDYYCKNFQTKPSPQHTLKDLKHPVSPKAYYFDTYEHARHFPENYPIDFVFGDVIHVPEKPSIVKSRPLVKNENSVLLNLDKARHFVFVKNDKPFAEKKNMLIGRGAVYQPHRIDFFNQYFNHPLCDLGQVNRDAGNPELWWKPKIDLAEHLDFKFILSLQGNDVATNLKWIMSSNSIAVMPQPTLETWFMEGTLIGGKHYIEIKPDYSDLESQLQYYIAHPDECLSIIAHAHEHCAQFFNLKVEKLTSLLVLEKYFRM